MHLFFLIIGSGLSASMFGLNDQHGDLTALGVGEDQTYLWPLGLLFVFFILLPGLYFWSQDLTHATLQDKKSRSLLSVNYYHVRHIGWIGPTFSIIACVVYSLIFHYENVTVTHCPGPNPLPSISAAVGNNIPERWFFRLGILLHSGQRFLDGIITHNFYKRLLPQTHWFHWLNQMATLLFYLETFSLFAIAMISSLEYYPAHEKAFMCWAFIQQARMIIVLYMFKNLTAHPWPGQWEQRSWRFKSISWAVNAIALLASGIVFVMHNLYCWPYLYALYGFFEYVVVATNIVQACSVACDGPEGALLVIKSVGRRHEGDVNGV